MRRSRFSVASSSSISAHDNIAGVGGVGAAHEHRVALQDAGVDHRVAAHFQREMFARGQDVGGTPMVWVWVWIASIGVPAAMRPMTGTMTGSLLFAPSPTGARTRPRLPSMTLGEKPRGARRRGEARLDRIRQPNHLDRAGPVGQALDEAALLQSLDQTVDSRLGAQVQRVLHLVEGRRHAGLLQPLVHEHEEFVLLARQHGEDPVPGESRCGTKHEQDYIVLYVFRKAALMNLQQRALEKTVNRRPPTAAG